MNEQAQDKIAQGIEFMSARKFELARDAFKDALAIDKKNAEAYVHLGNAYANLEQFDDAIDAFGKALILVPDSGTTMYSLGCVHFMNGNYVEALKQFNRCEDAGFASLEMYGLMELIFVDADDYVQAIRCANKAIKLEPLNAEPYVDKAQFYLLDGKPREALAALREVEQLLPDAGEPYLIEAQIYMQNEEPDQALAVLDRAAGRFDQDATVLIMKARILNDLGRFEEAVAVLDKAEEFKGEDTSIARDIAMVRSVAQVGLRNVESSIATLEEAFETTPDDADLLYLLANECYAVKSYEKAEKYSKLLVQVPEVGPRYRAAGIFWDAMSMRELGRMDEANKAFDDATSTLRQISIGFPGLAEVYIYRALCNSALGRFDDAYELIDHVIALMPEEAPGYAFKAQIAEEAGNVDLAREMRAKTLEIDPGFEF